MTIIGIYTREPNDSADHPVYRRQAGFDVDRGGWLPNGNVGIIDEYPPDILSKLDEDDVLNLFIARYGDNQYYTVARESEIPGEVQVAKDNRSPRIETLEE